MPNRAALEAPPFECYVFVGRDAFCAESTHANDRVAISSFMAALLRRYFIGVLRSPHVGGGGSVFMRVTGFSLSMRIASVTARSSCGS